MQGKKELLHFVCINSVTGNTIAYHTVPASLSEAARASNLEAKKAEIAVAHHLMVDTIYWDKQKDDEK
jgi:hypothetical protein